MKTAPGDPVEGWEQIRHGESKRGRGGAYLCGSGDCASGFHFCNPPPFEREEGEGDVCKLPQQHTSSEGSDAIRVRLTGDFHSAFMDALRLHTLPLNRTRVCS